MPREKEAEGSRIKCVCSQGPQGRQSREVEGRAQRDGDQPGSLTVGGHMPLEVNLAVK